MDTIERCPRTRYARARHVLLAGAILLATSAPAQSSDASPGFGVGGPGRIVGVWQVTVQLLNCATRQPLPVPAFPTVVAFHAGGTFSEDGPAPTVRTTAFGHWSVLARGHYQADSVFLNTAQGIFTSRMVVRRTIELAPDGESWVAEGRTLVTDLSGNAMAGCARGEAVRFR